MSRFGSRRPTAGVGRRLQQRRRQHVGNETWIPYELARNSVVAEGPAVQPDVHVLELVRSLRRSVSALQMSLIGCRFAQLDNATDFAHSFVGSCTSQKFRVRDVLYSLVVEQN